MLFAQSTSSHSFLEAALASLAFGVIGVALLLAGYFAFDLATRRIDVQEQLN